MKAYKTEVMLSKEQEAVYNATVGVCRFVYNLFIEVNDKNHNNGKPYINNASFSKWLNNEHSKDKPWIKDVSSKSVRNAIDNAHTAFMKFFRETKKPNYLPFSKQQTEQAQRTGKILTNYDMQSHPKYKKKHKRDCAYYFVRNDKNAPVKAERHKIKIPCLGWVNIKEYGYVPTARNIIISGTITKTAGRYYISVLTDESPEIYSSNTEPGMGVDLGLKDFAILSNGVVYKTNKHKKLNKKLKREQRRLSKKLENLKKSKERKTAKNIAKQSTKLARLNQRIASSRNDAQNKIVNEIVRAKPSYITIEDLNVRGMMKNRHLSKAIANQGFNMFVAKLTYKAKLNGIELRKADRFFPSSKLCHACGHIKPDLKLKDRVYKCECGYVEDRDLNAAMNLKDAVAYAVV